MPWPGEAELAWTMPGQLACHDKEKPSLHGEDAEKHCSQATEDDRQGVALL